METASTSNTFAVTDNPNDGEFWKVTVQVKDKDGGLGTTLTSQNFDVTNLPPVVTGINGLTGNGASDTPAAVGDTINMAALYTDNGIYDMPFTYLWTIAQKQADGITWTPVVTSTDQFLIYTPLATGRFRVSIQITDKDGAASNVFTSTGNIVVSQIAGGPILTGVSFSTNNGTTWKTYTPNADPTKDGVWERVRTGECRSGVARLFESQLRLSGRHEQGADRLRPGRRRPLGCRVWRQRHGRPELCHHAAGGQPAEAAQRHAV